MIRMQVIRKTFRFRFNARTSRGIMDDRTCWFLKVSLPDQPEISGLGEIAPLEGLSLEDAGQVEKELVLLQAALNIPGRPSGKDPESVEEFYSLQNFSSSVRFGAVSALLDLLNGGTGKIFESPFYDGTPVAINGLVWMDGATEMLESAGKKIEEGYHCIKIKVGSLQFEQECSILEKLRLKYDAEQLTIRLDANGAFSPADLDRKLKKLAEYDIHSIEQPLNKHDTLKYPNLLKSAAIPVALDEQLIGNYTGREKKELLQLTNPAFLVIKPGLTGGFVGSQEWISIAGELNIGWWITSALETPVGLNAIAQFTSLYNPVIPQGLGTGNVFEDLFEHPLLVKNGFLTLKTNLTWGLIK